MTLEARGMTAWRRSLERVCASTSQGANAAAPLDVNLWNSASTDQLIPESFFI